MSDDEDGFEKTRVRNAVFTIEERKLLLSLANQYSVVYSKKIDYKSTKEKALAWKKIHEEFKNSRVSSTERTPHQLKRCWENIRCKAKKGDTTSQQLIRWSESEASLSYNYREDQPEGLVDRSIPVVQYGSEDVDDLSENPVPTYPANSEEQNGGFDDSCSHCSCDKNLKNQQLNLVKIERLHNKKIFNMKMQNLREKEKRENELHKLQVHEMTIRVENERRRAQILDKELGRPG